MSKVTIVVDDSVVGVDGEFRQVDLSELPSDIHAVQWDGVRGEIEFKDNRPNVKINNINQFDKFVTAWENANKPQEPTPISEEVKEQIRKQRLLKTAQEILLEKVAPGLKQEIESGAVTTEEELRSSSLWNI